VSLIYTWVKTSKPKSNKRLARANDEHRAFLASVISERRKLIRPTTLKHMEKQDTPKKDLISLSDSIPYGEYKKSVDDYRWKKDLSESPETIKEIERKKGRIAPAFSKGALTYITDETDPTTIGRKL